MAVKIPEGFEPVSIDTLSADIEAIYSEEFRYGGYRTKKDRARVAQRTRRFYSAVVAITYGFTPVAYVGAEWAQRMPPRATKAVCNECGHTYVLRMRGLMYRHATEKHGKDSSDFPRMTELLGDARKRAAEEVAV